MKSESHVIKISLAKLIFLGPPERGKTLTRLRLEQVMENMETDPKYKDNPSTQVVQGETFLLSDLSHTAAATSESGWISLTEKSEEVKLLFELLYKLKQEADDSATTKTKKAKVDSPQHKKKLFTRKEPQNPFELCKEHILEMFEQSVTSHSLKDLVGRLENVCLLYMKDTGGQPELMDLLPALVIGPALYLLFCKLGEDLDKTYKVCLRRKPSSIPDRMSSCTVKENFLSTLSCIFSMHSYSARSNSETEDKLLDQVLQDTPDTIAYIVGTHKDEVSADEILEFDREMQVIMEDTVFCEKDLVHFVSRDGFEPSDPKDITPEGQDRLIYPIDNRFGSKKEIEGLQKFILNALNGFSKTEIPARWLPFNLYLRSMNQCYVTLSACYEYGRQVGMDKSETDIALWFFHHRLGVIMHFPNVPELKEFVITDTQWIFDSLSNLIFENGITMTRSGGKTFRTVGQISFDDIRKISEKVLPPEQMEALLKHLNVIAPLNKPLTGKLSYSQQHQLYFMPCVLENSSKEELKEFITSTKSGKATVYSIKLRYECGFAPIGVFPAVIANLVGQPSSTGIHGFKLADKENIKKNLIKFTYGKDRDKVVFTSTARYYEIIIIRPDKHVLPNSQVCTEVREKIEGTLTAMCDNSGSLLHNVESVCGGHQWAFDCPDHPGEDHLCVLEIGDEDPCKMECQKTEEWIDMEENHQMWFNKDYSVGHHRRQCGVRRITAVPVQQAVPQTQEQSNSSSNDGGMKLEELLQDLEMNEDQVKDRVSKSGLDFIARNICHKDWETYARELGIPENTMDDIKEDHARAKEQRIEGLKEWKKREGFRANYVVLVELFLKHNNAELAEDICKYVKFNT